jgi:hypothetical protein
MISKTASTDHVMTPAIINALSCNKLEDKTSIKSMELKLQKRSEIQLLK